VGVEGNHQGKNDAKLKTERGMSGGNGARFMWVCEIGRIRGQTDKKRRGV